VIDERVRARDAEVVRDAILGFTGEELVVA
jgi:hypothetical protein